MANSLEALRQYKSKQTQSTNTGSPGNTVEALRMYKSRQDGSVARPKDSSTDTGMLRAETLPMRKQAAANNAKNAVVDSPVQKNISSPAPTYQDVLKDKAGINVTAVNPVVPMQTTVKSGGAINMGQQIPEPAAKKNWVSGIGQSAAAGLAGAAKGVAKIDELITRGSINNTPPLTKALSDLIFPGLDEKILKSKQDRTANFEATEKYYTNKANEDASSAQQFAFGGVQAASAMLPNIILSILSGGTSTAATGIANATSSGIPGLSKGAISSFGNQLKEMIPFMTQTAGGYARDAELQGATPEQQVAYGIAGGLSEGMTEMLPMGALKKALGVGDDVAKGMIKKGTNNLIRDFGKKGLQWFVNAGEQVIQETAVEPMTGLAAKAIYDYDKPFVGQDGVIDFGQMGDAAKGALAMSLVLTALGLPVNAISHTKAESMVGKTFAEKDIQSLYDAVQKDAAQQEVTPQDANQTNTERSTQPAQAIEAEAEVRQANTPSSDKVAQKGAQKPINDAEIPAAGKTDSGASEMNPWDMDKKSLEETYLAKKDYEANVDKVILGDKYDEYNRAYKRQDNMNISKAERIKAEKTVESIENSLTESQRNELFGIGGSKYVASDYKDFVDAIGELDFSSPKDLGESLKYAITEVGDKIDPSLMKHSELTAFLQIKHAFEEANKLGWDTRQISQYAVKSSALRYSDPEDAMLMLERYINPKQASNQKLINAEVGKAMKASGTTMDGHSASTTGTEGTQQSSNVPDAIKGAESGDIDHKPVNAGMQINQTAVTGVEEKSPVTDVEKQFVSDYSAELPNTEDELKMVIADLNQQSQTEQDKSKLLKINLQLFAANEKLTAISKVRTNTLKKTVNLVDDEMQKIIDEIDMSYGVKPHKETIRKAENMVNSDMQGTMDRIKKNGLESAEDTAAAFLVEKALKEEAVKTGDFTILKSWLKTVQVSGTKHGQIIEAFKIWQQDPDGMLRNATKTVEDAEDTMKKKNPNKIKEIDDETNKVMDEMDQTDKEAADKVADEVNKKSGEFTKNKKQGAKKNGEKTGDTPPKAGTPNKDVTPEELLADKINSYIKEAKTPKNDPIMDMVNELFRVAKESPIDRKKVKARSAIEFVAEAIENRQQYVETWAKAKSIVMERLANNPEGIAKLEAYFDKGIKPPFSSTSFNKAIREGMAELGQNLGEIVRDYYAVGSRSRQELIDYLVEKSGLERQNAEVLAKYVNNRMKELTKAKKEQILKNIFKSESVKAPKKGALKSVEELSNVGAFVNENYKARVTGKLSPRLQRVINERFKGMPQKSSGIAAIDGRIDFGILVRRSTTEIDFTRTKFLKEISEQLQVNDSDARTILKAVEDRFNEIVQEKRASILGNMFKKRDPVAQKTGLQKVQEYINRQIELENLGAQEDVIRDFVKEKYGLPTLTNEDMAFITDHIEQIKKLEEGTRSYNEALWRIYNRIESKVPAGFIDKFRAWQRISMLPNIKTFTRNILGNVFMEKMENFNELTTEALVDWIASAFTGKREILGPTAAVQKSIAQTKGKIKGVTDFAVDMAHKVDTYGIEGQYEINRNKRAFKNPALNAIEQFTNRTLQFGDRPFYEAARARRLKELQILRKTKTITEEMEADAMLYALDRTFQNDSKLSGGVSRWKNAIDHPVYKTITNVIIPFAKTPANILDKISDYTPIGLAKAVGHLGRTAGKGTFDQKYFSQRLGRALTGAGMIVLGYILAQKDIITGKPEKTTSKKGAFDKDTGKMGYAIKTDDGYVAYDWAQPPGALLALGADAYNQGFKKGDILKGVEGAGNTFFNMSMLQSLNSIMSYGNPMGGFISTMLDSTQQFTPTAMKQLAKVTDKFERDASGEGFFEEAANKFKAAIPGLRQTLPIKTDTLGKEIELQEGYGPIQKIINIAANPANVSKNTMKNYEKELERLYKINQNSSVLPSILNKTIEDGDIEHKLTTEQYNKYKKLYGGIAVDGLKDNQGNYTMLGIEKTINSKEYKEMTDEQKAKRISRILTKAKEHAEKKMIQELRRK